jgi:hypothetical protein
VQDLSSRSEILHKILHEILHESLVTERVLDTLANMQCRRVGDMNEDMSPTCHRQAMSANEGLGRHDRLRHSLLRPREVKGGQGEQFELLLVIIDDLARVHPTWSGFELSCTEVRTLPTLCYIFWCYGCVGVKVISI